MSKWSLMKMLLLVQVVCENDVVNGDNTRLSPMSQSSIIADWVRIVMFSGAISVRDGWTS